MEIGGEGNDHLKYILLETHYDNPRKFDNITDSSGFKIHYTPTLREHSAAVVSIGLNSNRDGIFIPPGADRVVNYGC